MIFSNTKLQEQLGIVEERFRYIAAHYDINTQKIKAVADYFSKIESTHKSFAKKYSLHYDKMFNKVDVTPDPQFISPGNPGRTTYMVKQTTGLSSLVNRVSDTLIESIKTNVIDPLNNTAHDRDKLYQEVSARYTAAKEKQKTNFDLYQKSRASIVTSMVKMQEIETELKSQPDGTKAKVISKLKDSLKSAIIDYRNDIHMTNIMLSKFNYTYRKFVLIAKESVKTLIAKDNATSSEFGTVLTYFPKTFEQIATIYNDINEEFNSVPISWETDFMNFVDSNGICHTTFNSRPFQCNEFSFDDPQFFKPYYAVKRFLDFALYIAEVKNSEGGGVAGEKVYVYDNIQQDNVLISKTHNGPKLYFPSHNLQVCSERYVIAKRCQLASAPHCGSDFLNVQMGEALALLEEPGKEILQCKNLKGQTGKVHSSCLLFD